MTAEEKAAQEAKEAEEAKAAEAQKEKEEKEKAAQEADKKMNNISTEDLNKIFQEGVKEAFKDFDFGKAEMKHGVIPVKVFTDEEEKDLTPEQKKVKRVNKFFRAIYTGDQKVLDALQGKAALTEGISSGGSSDTGQYLYNTEFSAEVRRIAEQYGVIRRNATIYPMSRQKMNIPVKATGVTGAWATELAQKTVSNPTFTQKTLTRNEYAVLQVVTKQLLEDEEVDLLPIISEYVGEDFAREEDAQGFNGTGSPITGILQLGTTTDTTMTTNSILNITGDNLIDMTTSLSPGQAMGAKFYLHRTLLGLVRKLKTLDNSYIWQDLNGSAPGTIAGYPYEIVEAMPGTADDGAATRFITFGNLKRVLFGDRMTINTAMTTDATIGSINLFEQNAVGFRFEQSYDIQVDIPSALATLKTGA